MGTSTKIFGHGIYFWAQKGRKGIEKRREDTEGEREIEKKWRGGGGRQEKISEQGYT